MRLALVAALSAAVDTTLDLPGALLSVLELGAVLIVARLGYVWYQQEASKLKSTEGTKKPFDYPH